MGWVYNHESTLLRRAPYVDLDETKDALVEACVSRIDSGYISSTYHKRYRARIKSFVDGEQPTLPNTSSFRECVYGILANLYEDHYYSDPNSDSAANELCNYFFYPGHWTHEEES